MGELGVDRPTKRRAGVAAGGLAVADSRPVLDGDAVLGTRCTVCRYACAQQGIPWCPVCYEPVGAARFARAGAVWSSTVVAIAVGTRRPPFGVAYLDLDDGPRVLVHTDEPTVLAAGTRMAVVGTDDGDLIASKEVGA
ncbi:OB-fold domain-containing protein [Nocardia callitridis]|uniref:DUF35 domain-containing protein n=1 Tax=Nocardia callitridis TaxID=648753 RepID=A0ABP9K709_9NOCA